MLPGKWCGNSGKRNGETSFWGEVGVVADRYVFCCLKDPNVEVWLVTEFIFNDPTWDGFSNVVEAELRDFCIGDRELGIQSKFSCRATLFGGGTLVGRKASSLTGVTNGVVSGVASIAGSGGDSNTVSLDGVMVFRTIEFTEKYLNSIEDFLDSDKENNDDIDKIGS